jgi:hypothetical protein
MLVSGEISQCGVVFPENVFDQKLYEPFILALASRGVTISQKAMFDE